MSTLRVRITKADYYQLGGMRNSDLFRVARKDGSWTYWRAVP